MLTLHTGTIMHTNVVTDVRVARATGYGGIELQIPKLARYLDAGFTSEELRHELGSLQVTMLDTIIPIECVDPTARRRLLDDCERMASVAAELGCGVLQVVALDGFASDAWPEQRAALVASLRDLAGVAGAHGVRLAVEPVVFSRFRTLAQGLEVIDAVGADRVGLCLDAWHLWTVGVPWEEVAALDRELIAAVHLGDTLPRAGPAWRDADRAALPGEGVLPLGEAVDAIRATGWTGPWGVEMLSERHWEWDPYALAQAIADRVSPFVR